MMCFRIERHAPRAIDGLQLVKIGALVATRLSTVTKDSSSEGSSLTPRLTSSGYRSNPRHSASLEKISLGRNRKRTESVNVCNGGYGSLAS